MERTLVLVRHGKSDWSAALPDEARPLTPRGRRQSAESGSWLATHLGSVPYAALSPARRTVETFEIVRAAGFTADEVVHEPGLYVDSGAEVLAVVARFPPAVNRALVVGHEPTLSEAVELLTGRRVRVRTSEIAVLRWSGSWADVRRGGIAVLTTIGRPPPHGTR